jgi:hypothetical protein
MLARDFEEKEEMGSMIVPSKWNTHYPLWIRIFFLL